tara:strand:- start:80 stop:619 length:540 start_codon:yes stop_codon:yes gene_type:complete
MKKNIGTATFIGFTAIFAIWFSYLAPDPNPPTEGIPHNYYYPEVENYNIIIIDTVEVIKEDGIRWYTLDTLISAIMFIESSYNDSAYRADEDAVGCLQIRKCMVKDVNRILKRQKSDLRFTYNSRWSRDSSIQMFEIYCKHYNLTTAEEVARCWNGGPRGINNPATVGYWEKVKDEINS